MRTSSILVLVIAFFTSELFAQDLDAKIDSLRWMASGEEYGDKIPTAQRILEIDPLNPYAHKYIVNSYVNLGEYQKAYSYVDSIMRLPRPDPKVLLSLSYGLRHMAPKDSVYDYHYFRVLSKCLDFPETKADAAYFLSDAYYSDFIKPFKKEPPTLWKWEIDSALQYKSDKRIAEQMGISIDSLRKRKNQIKTPESVYEHSGDSALKYLKVLSESESPYKQIAKIPIAQLEQHLGDVNRYKLDSNLYNNHYFPEWYFGYLKKDWKNDLSTDLFGEMLFTSYRSVDFLSKQLSSFNEPILFPHVDQLTYRITWLPSFEHPIVIRIVKSETGGKIIWKVGNGKGGYEPEGIKNQGTSNLDRKKFDRISGILDSTEICSEYHYDYMLMTDGVSLILEKVNNNQFCAHETNVPSKAIKELLTELSRIYFEDIETGIEK